MLINGFGVERADSTPIYSAALMPNLDRMSNNYLFSTLSAPQGDYNEGVKSFAKKEIKKTKYDQIDNLIFDQELGKVESLNTLKRNIANKTLHIFYVFDGPDKYYQVKEIIKYINQEKDKKITLSIIFTGTSVTIYKELEKILNKMSYELLSYCKSYIVLGKNNLNSNNFIRAFYKSQGEHWNEANKKLTVLTKELVVPETADIFLINNDVTVQNNDCVLFLNYDNIDTKTFMEKHKALNLSYYSLYPEENMINLFDRVEGEAIKITDVLRDNGINLTVFTTQERLDSFNYFINGERKTVSPNIRYILNDDGLFSKENVLNTINNSNPAIIIDYDLSGITQIKELKEKLTNIDTLIGNIDEVCVANEYSFIVTSLYGIHKSLKDGPVEKVINFGGKVPIVYYNKEFDKANYILKVGDVFALCMTYLTNVCDSVKKNMLISKKGKLEKMFSKK